jgi:diadenosine tetraphosphate (Ap4A) HIT family hydrolase
MEFEIDAKLASDSRPIGRLRLCDLRLMRDARWPWLILIPRRNDVAELFELVGDEAVQAFRETTQAAAALKRVTRCEKINIAALGNVVRQLHIHVVARNAGDANWPQPVWGFGMPEFGDGMAPDTIAALAGELAKTGYFHANHI